MKIYRKKIDSLLSTKSDTKSTNIPKFKFAEPDISNSKSYMFTRKLSGANVGDNYIQETILRKNDYKFNTGDLLQPQQDNSKDSSYEFMIDFQIFNDLVKVGHGETPDDDIICYHQVKVEYSDELHRNVISHYADGNPILVKGVPFTILPSEDPEKFKGHPGDIIDYAFYLHPGFKIEDVINRGIVRWKYPVEDDYSDNTNTLEAPSEKTEPSQKKQKSNTTYKGNHQQLDLDLKGQSVLVLSDYARSEKLEEVIKSYNGKPTVTGGNNSSEQLPPMLEKLILGSDITIICTDYMHHRVSQQVIDVLKEKDDAKYAVASSSSRTFIERALYRAENGLQAYEASGSDTIEDVMTQSKIDAMAQIPEVAQILQAAKNWTPQVMEKDGYTLKAYEGHQSDSFDPHGFKTSQLIFSIQWGKEAAKPQTQPATQKPTQKVTQAVTQKPTQKPTQAVTQKLTQKVTQAVTQKPTQKVTQAVTQKPTQKVTQASTQKPTQKVTQAVTQKPTQKVTQASTQKPTQKVTQAVTQKPSQKVTQAVTPAPISIGTTLIGTSGHELAISKDAIATDTVNYTGLIVGQKYTMTGTLMNKATGKPVMNNGKAVTASTTFTAQKANGSVTVIFHLDDTDYEGDSLVAFESLSDGTGKQIANHDDINDKAETDIVEKPEIGTTLVGSTGTHLLPFSDNTVATDTVNYTDLIPGKQYKLVGTLMDKATGKPVMNNGKPVTATTIFTPTTANGVATVVFHFNDEGYKGDALVAYEDLYDAKSGQLIAKHEDLNDLSETDTVKKPKKHTPMIQYQTQSQNVYVPGSSSVIKAASSAIESPAAPVVEQVASPAPAVQATSPAPAKGVAQGQGLPETADMSSLTGEALAAAAALAGTVMLIKNHEDEFED